MGLFNNFPWTNFHEVNLDWIIRQIKDLQTAMPAGLIGIPKGGTGADNAADARDNLGITAENIKMYSGLSQTIEQAMNIMAGNISDLDDALDYRIFKTVVPLGLSSGTAAISSIWTVMSAGDMLLCPPDEVLAGECPESYGSLWLVRSGGNSGCCLFIGKDHLYRKDFSSNYPQAGWEQVYGDADIIPITNGGTGADNASDALTNLGIDFSGTVLSVAGVGADPTGDVPLTAANLDVNYTLYTDITELGIPVGSTLSAVWTAIGANNAIVIFPSSQISDPPSANAGMIQMIKNNDASSGYILYFSKESGTYDQRMRLSGGSPSGTWENLVPVTLGGLATNFSVGISNTGNFYIRSTDTNGKIWQLSATSSGQLYFETNVGGTWTHVWTK